MTMFILTSWWEGCEVLTGITKRIIIIIPWKKGWIGSRRTWIIRDVLSGSWRIIVRICNIISGKIRMLPSCIAGITINSARSGITWYSITCISIVSSWKMVFSQWKRAFCIRWMPMGCRCAWWVRERLGMITRRSSWWNRRSTRRRSRNWRIIWRITRGTRKCGCVYPGCTTRLASRRRLFGVRVNLWNGNRSWWMRWISGRWVLWIWKSSRRLIRRLTRCWPKMTWHLLLIIWRGWFTTRRERIRRRWIMSIKRWGITVETCRRWP